MTEVRDTRGVQLSTQNLPAIGGGGRQSRRFLMRLSAVGFLLIITLVAAKHIVAAREIGQNPLAWLPAGRTVAVGLDIGGAPTDYTLQALTNSNRVDGLVNIGEPDVAEQVAAASLNMAYMHLPVASGAAPTRVQLRTLANFMRRHASGGAYVYLHDDVGGGRAVATAEMLLLLRGESWQHVQQDMTPGELSSLSASQSMAVEQLTSALHSLGHSLPGNPYSGSRVYPW
jgi:hypothetical protein